MDTIPREVTEAPNRILPCIICDRKLIIVEPRPGDPAAPDYDLRHMGYEHGVGREQCILSGMLLEWSTRIASLGHLWNDQVENAIEAFTPRPHNPRGFDNIHDQLRKDRRSGSEP